MVEETRKKNRILFRCQECGFHYTDEKIAEKCENWCRKYKSCNVEITKLAVENQ